MSIAAVGMGGNLGEVIQSFHVALKLINQRIGKVLAASKVYRTKAQGFTEQPDFINAAIVIESNLLPLKLLKELLKIEDELGRKRSFKNSPRTIDLDLLLFDDLEINSGELTIPHPRMTERSFVMIPLSEIAPCWVVKSLKVRDYCWDRLIPLKEKLEI